MAMVLPAAPTLHQMEGDADALTVDWFRLFAEDLDGTDAEVCTKIGDAFKKWRLTRLGALFKLTRVKALETIAQANAGAPPEDNEAWLESIQMTAGFAFGEATVPSSAALAAPGLRSSGVKANNAPSNRVPTITEELQAKGTLVDEDIPPSSFLVIETPDPHLHEITEPELEAWTDSVLESYGERFLRFNLGRPLCRHLGRKAINKIKLPTYGGKKGDERNIGQMLYDKSRNRKTVSSPHVSNAHRRSGTHSSSEHVLDSCDNAEGVHPPPHPARWRGPR